MGKFTGNIALLLTFSLLPNVALSTKFLNPEKPGFHADTVYNDDVFIAGEKIKFDSKVYGDLFTFSQEVVQSDSVTGGFNSFAYSIQALGSVGGSFRGFARFISCNAPVGRNVLGFAQEITFGPQTVIGRDADLFCEKLVFQGSIAGDLRTECDAAVISGTVGGEFRFSGNSLTIGPDAVIMGDLRYKSPEKAEISSSAQITGEIYWRETEIADMEKDSGTSLGKATKAIAWLVSLRGYLLSMTVVSLILFIFSAIPLSAGLSIVLLWIMLAVSGNIVRMLTGQKAAQTESLLNKRFFPSMGLGFIIFLLAPIVTLVLLLTFVGTPLGMLLILLFGVATFLGGIYGTLFVGRKVCGFIGIKSESAPGYLCYTIGMVIMVGLSHIPIIGYLLAAALLMTGLGGLCLIHVSHEEKQG